MVQYALSRRPNVRLVETGLGFGVEGFRRYRGKVFDEKMAWARRYYPHKYNLDGFFVAKLRKVGPSPEAKKVGVDVNGEEGVEVEVDRTVVGDDKEGDGGEDEFGGFNDEEDEEIIERARRQRLRRKGLNPKAAAMKTGDGIAKSGVGTTRVQ